MYYIIYKTTNLINNKIYIGKHKTEDPFDSYLGSGYALLKAIKKYGKENFKKEILHYCSSVKEMIRLESELVNKEFVACTNNYNIVLGGGGGCISLYKENPKYEEICEKISNSRKGRTPWNKGLTKETSESIRVGHAKTTESRKKNGTYDSNRKGKPLPYETRKKLSEANKGKIHSEETKKKMSESHRIRALAPSYVNSMIGKIGANKGKKFSEKTKKLLSNSHKKRAMSDGYINPMQGKNHSEETIELIKCLKSKGTYITPWGNFISVNDAANHPMSTIKYSGTILKRCKKQTEGYNFIPKI